MIKIIIGLLLYLPNTFDSTLIFLNIILMPVFYVNIFYTVYNISITE